MDWIYCNILQILSYLSQVEMASNTLIFLYLLWFLILNTSIIVVFTTHPIHSILALIAVFIEVGILLLFLGLEYVAFVFLVVYVGAIAVLFLFVTMMLNIRQLEFNISILAYLPATIFIIFSFFLNFIFLFFKGKANFKFTQYVPTYERFTFLRTMYCTFIVNPDEKTNPVPIPAWLTDEIMHPLIQQLLYSYVFNVTVTKPEGVDILIKKDSVPLRLSDGKLESIQINVSDIFYTLTNIEAIGHCLYTYFYVAFLASAIVLLVAMVGSISLTLYHKSNIKRQFIDKQWLRDFIVILKK